MSFDPLAESSSPSISFKDVPIGYEVTGTVVGDPEMVQSRDFKTKEPATWPDGNPKMSLVIKMDLGSEIRSLWAPKPSAMWAALVDARARAGVPLGNGCRLTVKFTGTKPTAGDPQKLYSASYSPPVSDPLGSGSSVGQTEIRPAETSTAAAERPPF